MASILLDSNGDWDITLGRLTLVTDAPETAQKVAARLRFHRGEWFLDLRQGVPFWEAMLIKNPDLDAIRQIIRRVIAETPGVKSIEKLDLSWDRPRRKLTITFEATHDSGARIIGGRGTPLIVETNP